MSNLPKFTITELMEAGVHFGHKTMRWNPKMAPYIYGERNKLHIINLQKTVPLLHKALEVTRDVASKNKRILFVSTKRQASAIVAEAAERCGQYYVNHRWLGGMLTNWNTVSKSIKTLKDLDAQLQNPDFVANKKERLVMQRQLDKLENSLGGIKDMGGTPDLIVVIDTNKESIAILEANKLGVPVIAIADTNSNPDGIDYIVPGNDDSSRSISLYCKLLADAALSGVEQALGSKKVAATKAAPAKKANTKEEKPAAKKAAPAKKADAKEEKPETKKTAEIKKAPIKAKATKSDAEDEAPKKKAASS